MTQEPIGQRIKFIIGHFKLSVRKFANILDVSETNIRNYMDRGTKPSSDVLEKVVNNFPQVNMKWLLTGEGIPFFNEPGTSYEPSITNQKNVSGIAQTGSNSVATQHNYSIADCEKERDTYMQERDLARAELAGLRQQLEMAQALIEAHKETISLLRGGYNRPN